MKRSDTLSWWETLCQYAGQSIPYAGQSIPSDYQSDPANSPKPANYWFDEESKRTFFHQYAQNGDLASIENLILQTENDKVRKHLTIPTILGYQDINGYTALHLACKYGHKNVIQIFFQYMSSKDMQKKTNDKDGYNALHFACLHMNDPEIVKLLIYGKESTLFCSEITQEGKKIFTVATNGWNPLHCAAAKGHDKVVEYLLKEMLLSEVISCTRSIFPIENHVKLNHKVAGTTDTIYNYIGKNGFSALHLAASKGHFSTVNLLLSYFSTFDYSIISSATESITSKDSNNSSDTSSLDMITGSWDEVKQQPYGSSKTIPGYIKQVTEEGNKNTALHLAAKGGFTKVVKALLTHNQNLGLIKNDNGDTALHLVSNKKCALELIRVENHPPFNSQNQYGNTPLHEATLNNRFAIVKLLLDSMQEFPELIVKCYQPNASGQTPLHLSSNDTISQLLFTNLNNQYHKLFFTNVERQIREIKETTNDMGDFARRKTINTDSPLEPKKPIYAVPDGKGNTALHYASYHGLKNTVNLFLLKEGSVFANLLNKEDCAAIHLAKDDDVGIPILTYTSKEIYSAHVPYPRLSESRKYCNDSAITVTTNIVANPKNERNAKTTLLHIKVQQDQLLTVKALLKENAGLVNLKDSHDNTPFHLVSSDEMGKILLPHITDKHLSSINKAKQTILHMVVQKNLCTKVTTDDVTKINYIFIEELIKKCPSLLSTQDVEGAFPIDLANTREMAHFLVSHYNKQSLKIIIARYKGDWSQGIGLIITELSPDLLKHGITIYHAENEQNNKLNSGSSANSSNATRANNLLNHLEKELSRTNDVLTSLFDEFVMIEEQQVDGNIDPNKTLLKAANLFYALGRTKEAIESYNRLFLLAPQYIADTLNCLTDIDNSFIKQLLELMQQTKHGLWRNDQLPNEINDNLLYKFAAEDKRNILISLLEAKISIEYLDQALKFAIEKKEMQIIASLLDTLTHFESDNELWRLPGIFLCRIIESENHDILDIFLKYMPSEIINTLNKSFKFLYQAQSEEMVRKLVHHYPDLTNDSNLDENLDSDQHCIPLIANYNCADQRGYLIHCKKGYALELLDRKQQALKYFLKAQEYFPKYESKSQDLLEYSCEVVRKLIETQIDNQSTIVKVFELSKLDQAESSLEVASDRSQAIALKLPNNKWVSIYIKLEETLTIVCNDIKAYPQLRSIISNINIFLLEKGFGVNCINLDQTERDGLPTSVVETLVLIANYKEGFTKAAISRALTNQVSIEKFYNKHLLMLEHQNFYSDLKLHELLKILVPETHISPAIDLNNHSGLIEAIKLALDNLSDGIWVAAIPLHPNEKQWSSLVIKQEDDGGLLIIYSDMSGNLLSFETESEIIMGCILQSGSKATFVNSKNQHSKSNDNGAWTVENVLALIKGQTLEFDLKAAEQKHLQLLQTNGIPVQNVDDEDLPLATSCFQEIKSYDDCIAMGRAAYESGKIKYSLNYFTKAVKLYGPQFPNLEVKGAKYQWLAENASSNIFTAICQIIESYKASKNDSKFGVVAIKSLASYSALLLGFKQNIIQMIHFDSKGTLLADKGNIVTIIGEFVSDIALSIVDVAGKVKDTTVECFEEALEQLQQFDSDLLSRDALQKQLVNHLQIGTTGEGLGFTEQSN